MIRGGAGIPTSPNGFCSEAPNLRSFVFAEGSLSSLSKISLDFCTRCPKLDSITIKSLEHVEMISQSAFSNSPSLAKVVLGPKTFSDVVMIGNSVFSGCGALEDLDLAPITSCERIGSGFCQGNSKMKSIRNFNMSYVASIQSCFCMQCSSLEEFDGLRALTGFAIPTTRRQRKLNSGFYFAPELDASGNITRRIDNTGFMEGCDALKSKLQVTEPELHQFIVDHWSRTV